MRIISKFHDYYDSVTSFGQDPSLVYNRETSKVKYIDRDKRFPKMYLEFCFRNRTSREWWDYRSAYIGFCGKIYPAIFNLNNEYFFTYDSFFKHLSENFPKRIEDFLTGKRNGYFWNKNLVKNNEKSTKEFFDNVVSNVEIFQKLKTPVFSFGYVIPKENGYYKNDVTEYELTLNPMLRELGFQSKVDPFTAYQEISMFLGGVIGQPEKDTIDISDKDMLYKKGFDMFSFKRAPGKIKPRTLKGR